jgi:SpoU rRNA methylase family enzyme
MTIQAVSPELQNQISIWRIKAGDGTITLDEMREAIKALRGNRLAAAAASSGSKVKKAPKDVSDMLGELDGL